MSAGERSRALMAASAELMPGGVNSPVRAFAAVGGTPPVIAAARGAHVRDEDGREYLDYVMAFGPHILGHGASQVRDAVAAQLERGIAYGAPTELELELARRIVEAVPSVEMVRLVNSGTEATMSALRLARAATGRNRVIKFAGAYHGHADLLLAEAGSGVATLGIPGSPGVPEAVVADTVTVAYNDAAAVAAALDAHRGTVAAVIVEPVAGNMGCVPPRAGFLEALRRLTREHGALLVFDEVITGFRVAYGGAQELYGVRPDLTCLGKVIGGGLPVGAYGGSADLMRLVAPAGPVYQAGTLSGSPLAMAAGCAVLDTLRAAPPYAALEELSARLAAGLAAAAEEAGVPCAVNRVGSMVTPFVGVAEVGDFGAALRADRVLFARVHHAWLEGGVLWPPSQFETAFLSTAHTAGDVDRTVAIFAGALRAALPVASARGPAA